MVYWILPWEKLMIYLWTNDDILNFAMENMMIYQWKQDDLLNTAMENMTIYLCKMMIYKILLSINFVPPQVYIYMYCIYIYEYRYMQYDHGNPPKK